jgi:dipicolinate synthase subunit A
MIDERMSIAGDYLVSKGYELVDNSNDADFVLLPIPVKDYMFENLDNKIIFYGAGNYRGFDYNKLESFLLENAYLTSEGAIALLKQNSEKSIYSSNILITGYGRIATALHKALSAMGAKITVCCRSDKDKTTAQFNGADVISFDKLKDKNKFDFIFNTVPHLIFTKQELDSVNDDTILIDLASFPGGVDTLYAKSKGIRLIDGRKLPSKYSKISAGELIGQTVEKMIKEDFS